MIVRSQVGYRTDFKYLTPQQRTVTATMPVQSFELTTTGSATAKQSFSTYLNNARNERPQCLAS